MNDHYWHEATPSESPEPVAEVETPAVEGVPAAEVVAPASFAELSLRLNDNLANATLRLVDAAQDFTGLIRSYVAAGLELEQSLASVREVADTSRRVLEEARQAADAAAASARDAQAAQQKSVDLIQRSTSEHLALAELTDNLRQRISALSILGAPMPHHEVPASLSEEPKNGWDAA